MPLIKHLVISGGGPTMIQTLGSIQFLEENKFIDISNIDIDIANIDISIVTLSEMRS